MTKRDLKSIVGVYHSHLEAVEAIKILKKHHYSLDKVALVSKGGSVKDIDGVHTWEDAIVDGTKVGATVGGILGVLSGLSMFIVPEVGLVYAAGMWAAAALGAVEGAAFGGLGGSLFGTILGLQYGTEGEAHGKPDPEDEEKFKKILAEDKFLLIIHGTPTEVEQAHKILEDESKHVTIHGQYLN